MASDQTGQCLLEVFFSSSFISCLLAQGVAGEDDGPEEEVSQDGEEADGQEGGAVGGEDRPERQIEENKLRKSSRTERLPAPSSSP